MRSRTGGSVTNVIVGLAVLWLSFSVIFFYVRNLGQVSSGESSSAGAASSITSIRATNSTLTESIRSTSVADNFSLAQLETLSFSNSSKCDGLLDAKYWDTAIQTSGNTTAHLIPNTVYSLSQSWNGWTDFFRTNMSNPPPWLSAGVANYTSSFEAQLAARVMSTNNITQAAAVMKNYTAYLGGIEATGVDFLSWGGLSVVKVYYQTGDFRQAVSQTFPGQLDQLFKLSQDCSYSEQQRGQFMGMALSMGALVLATSGKDGFGPQFQDLLTKLGIQDIWKGIKSSLKNINDASPGAAYETTLTLAALAKNVVSYPGVSTLGGITAEFAVEGYAGQTTDLRIRYDGFSFGGGQLQLVQGENNLPISLVSYDGFRLKLVYGSNNNVATLYIKPPSKSIYGLDAKHPYSGPYLDLVQGKYANAWQIDNVVMQRDLEKAMLDYGGSTNLGRIGSEISFLAGQDLGLKDLVIPDPAQGGRDLYTQDNSVAIQARFLKNLGLYPETTIQTQLLDLATKLQQDYENQPNMRDGYAILSYVDTDGMVKTIIVEVPRW